MSSLPRTLQRNRLRAKKEHEPRPRPYRYDDAGGYSVLTPTSGWKRVSAARLRAQARLSAMIDRVRLRMIANR